MNGAANFLVFRDSKAVRSVASEWCELGILIQQMGANPGPEPALEALLYAAEMECGLADVSPSFAKEAAKVTDELAFVLMSPSSTQAHAAERTFSSQSVPRVQQITVSRPEGFSYYALHPRAYAGCTYPLEQAFAVVGIRSAGVVLSAVTRAALIARGNPAVRMTVRPTGHPYDRMLAMSEEEREWVRLQGSSGAHFLVVDEGPGLSGSSFLAVGDALVDLGISASRITFIGSRSPEVGALCGRDAPARWRRFGWQVIPDLFGDHPDAMFIGEGRWRSNFMDSPADWPACWPNMERIKFLSGDGENFLKFDGLGRYGRAVLQRSQRIHEGGFGVRVKDNQDGITIYERVVGKPLALSDLNEDVLTQLASYCAFRSHEFGVQINTATLVAEMTRHNVLEEIGIDTEMESKHFETEQALITDGRMQPWEWIRKMDGKLVKSDGSTHGDDHFFPGPTDIAWDLAGAIVEWNMDGKSAEFLVREFRRRGGKTNMPRLSAFLIAYCAFRVGYCKMAAQAVNDPMERRRLLQASEFYRNRLMCSLDGCQDCRVTI